jgi:hypothetical protein
LHIILTGNARLQSFTPSDLRYDPVLFSMREESAPVLGDEPQQIISVRLPRNLYGRAGFSAEGLMERSIGQLSGDVAEVTFPYCGVNGDLFGSCTVDGGEVMPGETVTFVSAGAESPSSLVWETGINWDVGAPRARISSEELARDRSSYLFISGAMIGLAGGAAVELVIRMTHLLSDVPRKRRRRNAREQKQESGITRTTSAETQAAQILVGERWATWLSQRRRN